MNDQYPLSAIQWAQQQMSQYGRVGATKIVKIPALAAPIPASVGAGSLAQPPLLTWQDPGWVIAMYGQEQTGTIPKFAQTELSLQFPGDEFFITNGSGGDFAPFLALFGPNVNWIPMTRRVVRQDNWTATYRNTDTLATAFPSVLFTMIRDKDMAEVQEMMNADLARRRG